MGYETTNAAFHEAAARAQAIHDSRSPAEQGDAFVAEILSGGEPLRTFIPPVIDDGKGEDAAAETAQAASNAPSFFFNRLAEMVAAARAAEAEKAARQAAQQAAADAEDEASDAFIVAQRLSLMSTSMEQFADELEMEGLGMVADFLRSGASKTRKGARLAREIARETLDVEVAAA